MLSQSAFVNQWLNRQLCMAKVIIGHWVLIIGIEFYIAWVYLWDFELELLVPDWGFAGWIHDFAFMGGAGSFYHNIRVLCKNKDISTI